MAPFHCCPSYPCPICESNKGGPGIWQVHPEISLSNEDIDKVVERLYNKLELARLQRQSAKVKRKLRSEE